MGGTRCMAALRARQRKGCSAHTLVGAAEADAPRNAAKEALRGEETPAEAVRTRRESPTVHRRRKGNNQDQDGEIYQKTSL